MNSAEIRSRWLKFFESGNSQGLKHTVVPSASLIADDPNLLLVNAGMVPFKPFFLGEVKPPYERATSVQKCVRTLDIEEVGKTTRHASFFQMCGNFSFGNYFKEGAISLAWELLTKPVSEGGYGFPESKLWVTVFQNDDEAADIWHNKVGVPKDRIQRRGMEDNFWSMGVPGPCGPCSEIYYDRGPEYGRDGGPVADEDRYLEIWNLVFMQNIRGAGAGKDDYPILGELPAKNIDTGLGLERTAALLQGVDNIYEIDTTMQILNMACELTGVKYGANEKSDVALRVIADHARTTMMLIGDGVLPGNEGRGYVLRRMMRRTIRNMRILGAGDPSSKELVGAAIGAMGAQYPELIENAERITALSVNEEESFLATLKSGTTLFDTAASQVKKAKLSALSGDTVFKLHDTFGFPFDLTLEMASEKGLAVDEDGFRKLMKEQKDRAKADARTKKTGHTDVSEYRKILDGSGATKFLGYSEMSSEAVLKAIMVDGKNVVEADIGAQVEIILDRTPFYAEGGGQLADGGRITLANGAVIEIDDVQCPVPGLFVHRGEIISGGAKISEKVLATIDRERRLAISRAHTATHMVHKAFREALGESATQAGSENSPGRFRFDFPATGAVSQATLSEVESRVNTLLLDDLEVTAKTMTQPEAKAMGAMALFGEKYGDQVRVVSVGDWAHELCGGTHVVRSGELGVVKLLSEASIGAGVRRVEALVGADAYRFLAREHHLVNQLTEIMKARPEELVDRVGSTLERLKNAERDIAKARRQALMNDISGLVGEPTKLGDTHLYRFTAPSGTDAGELRDIVTSAKSDLKSNNNVVVAACVGDDKVSVVVATDSAARDSGVSAQKVIAKLLKAIDGRGGGNAEMAQGAGANIAGLDTAFTTLAGGLLD